LISGEGRLINYFLDDFGTVKHAEINTSCDQFAGNGAPNYNRFQSVLYDPIYDIYIIEDETTKCVYALDMLGRMRCLTWSKPDYRRAQGLFFSNDYTILCVRSKDVLKLFRRNMIDSFKECCSFENSFLTIASVSDNSFLGVLTRGDTYVIENEEDQYTLKDIGTLEYTTICCKSSTISNCAISNQGGQIIVVVKTSNDLIDHFILFRVEKDSKGIPTKILKMVAMNFLAESLTICSPKLITFLNESQLMISSESGIHFFKIEHSPPRMNYIKPNHLLDKHQFSLFYSIKRVEDKLMFADTNLRIGVIDV